MQTGVATATQGQATMFTTTDSMGSTAEAKLLSYLDVSPSTSKVIVRFAVYSFQIVRYIKFDLILEFCQKEDECAQQQKSCERRQFGPSLSISFGWHRYEILFEYCVNIWLCDWKKIVNVMEQCNIVGALVSAGFEVSATVVHDSLTTVPNANGLDASSSVSTNKKTTDHLVDWLTNVPEHEL